MKVKTTIVDREQLEKVINEIGYENILNILPDHNYDGTLFVIIYKKSDMVNTKNHETCYPVYEVYEENGLLKSRKKL